MTSAHAQIIHTQRRSEFADLQLLGEVEILLYLKFYKG